MVYYLGKYKSLSLGYLSVRWSVVQTVQKIPEIATKRHLEQTFRWWDQIYVSSKWNFYPEYKILPSIERLMLDGTLYREDTYVKGY